MSVFWVVKKDCRRRTFVGQVKLDASGNGVLELREPVSGTLALVHVEPDDAPTVVRRGGLRIHGRDDARERASGRLSAPDRPAVLVTVSRRRT